MYAESTEDPVKVGSVCVCVCVSRFSNFGRCFPLVHPTLPSHLSYVNTRNAEMCNRMRETSLFLSCSQVLCKG